MRLSKYWRCVWIGKKTDIWGSQNICYYCGQRASTVDHVIPQSMIRQLTALGDEEVTYQVLGKRALKVWSCRECNCLASDSIQESLQERKAYVKEKLRRRYQKLLDMPPWSQDELDVLGYALKTHVEASIKARDFVKQRIAW